MRPDLPEGKEVGLQPDLLRGGDPCPVVPFGDDAGFDPAPAGGAGQPGACGGYAPGVRKRRSGTSPTQRSLAKLRADGYTVAIVERWNPHAKIRQDLFGFIDLLAIREGETLAVQSCSGTDVSKRVAKIADADCVGAVRKAGWRIVVHGWVKRASGKWECREVDCS